MVAVSKTERNINLIKKLYTDGVITEKEMKDLVLKEFKK